MCLLEIFSITSFPLFYISLTFYISKWILRYSQLKVPYIDKWKLPSHSRDIRCDVMVHCTCQLGWAMVPRYLVKHYSEYFCETVF